MKTVLVVDDEPRLRLLYRDALEDEGYAVAEAGSGDAAMEVLSRQAVDLIILDIRMKGTHGLELLPTLHTSYARIPVIICSGVDSLFGHYAIWEAGEQVVGMFRKPVNLAELIDCVDRALGAPSPSAAP